MVSLPFALLARACGGRESVFPIVHVLDVGPMIRYRHIGRQFFLRQDPEEPQHDPGLQHDSGFRLKANPAEATEGLGMEREEDDTRRIGARHLDGRDRESESRGGETGGGALVRVSEDKWRGWTLAEVVEMMGDLATLGFVSRVRALFASAQDWDCHLVRMALYTFVWMMLRYLPVSLCVPLSHHHSLSRLPVCQPPSGPLFHCFSPLLAQMEAYLRSSRQLHLEGP
jgi:hypothetical protein